MKMALKILGVALIVMGVADLVGSYAGFDLWGVIGVDLPEIIWRYSAYLEMIAGYALFKAADAMGGEAAEEPAAEA